MPSPESRTVSTDSCCRDSVASAHRDLIAVQGYYDAASTFQAESGTAPSTNLDTCTDRMHIRNAVEAGKIEDAIERVNDLNPEVSALHACTPTHARGRRQPCTHCGGSWCCRLQVPCTDCVPSLWPSQLGPCTPRLPIRNHRWFQVTIPAPLPASGSFKTSDAHSSACRSDMPPSRIRHNQVHLLRQPDLS